jgi:hypothetical protein
MTKKTEKSVAMDLRKTGKSYSEIGAEMKKQGYAVSRGVLTNWLKEIDLTPDQKQVLLRKEVEPGLAAIRKKYEERAKNVEAIGKEEQKQLDSILLDGGFTKDETVAG